MTREELCGNKDRAVNEFLLEGPVVSCERYGNGHINDTFLVVCGSGEATVRYILQRINTDVFTKPAGLMHNIELVTEYIAAQAEAQGRDASRETLRIVRTKSGKNSYCDSYGSYWRMYEFVEGTVSYDQVERPEDFYQSAYAFGNFQRLLADFDPSTLNETIPNFHNTPVRFAAFLKAVEEDRAGRAHDVMDEIEFFVNHRDDMQICQSELENGRLPLRVTHNDTKLNNILIDSLTGKGLCVIDLDTVMPGLSIFDFGDSIRFGANTACEDEKDLSKVSLDLDLYGVYAKGYLKGCGGRLTDEEIRMMPFGAKVMTLECGMRFLTDYLEGDVYFMVHRKDHNLDRCRTQIALVKDMERKWEEMKKITEDAAR